MICCGSSIFNQLLTLRIKKNLTKLNPTELALLILSTIFMRGLFTSGALQSVDKPMPELVKVLHRILPYLAVLSSTGLLILIAASEK
jgi:hypothetical protein